MMYNPNHPVYCSCPQCSWWSLSGATSWAQSDGPPNYPPQSQVLSDLTEPAHRYGRILMLFALSGSQIELRASASRNLGDAGAKTSGLEGWV